MITTNNIFIPPISIHAPRTGSDVDYKTKQIVLR